MYQANERIKGTAVTYLGAGMYLFEPQPLTAEQKAEFEREMAEFRKRLQEAKRRFEQNKTRIF
jgi:hypothetical protein